MESNSKSAEDQRTNCNRWIPRALFHVFHQCRCQEVDSFLAVHPVSLPFAIKSKEHFANAHQGLWRLARCTSNQSINTNGTCMPIGSLRLNMTLLRKLRVEVDDAKSIVGNRSGSSDLSRWVGTITQVRSSNQDVLGESVGVYAQERRICAAIRVGISSGCGVIESFVGGTRTQVSHCCKRFAMDIAFNLRSWKMLLKAFVDMFVWVEHRNNQRLQCNEASPRTEDDARKLKDGDPSLIFRVFWLVRFLFYCCSRKLV